MLKFVCSFLFSFKLLFNKKFVSQELVLGTGIVTGDTDTVLWFQNDDPFTYCMG